jgi:N-acetylglucosamine kinase-like BadF-type ATPase
VTDAPLVLGIDGGGTSTVAWLADEAGRVLGRGRAGPSNARAIGEQEARRALDTAIAAAFHDAGLPIRTVAVACLGMAGFDRPDDRRQLESWARDGDWAGVVLAVTDGELLLAAGTPEGWGVGIVAGTGSIAVGRDRDGRPARAGGWGYLLGDEGSAYAVTLAALRAVMRLADGRAASGTTPDPLVIQLCAALDAEAPAQLVTRVYRPEMDRTRLAALAPVVVSAAADGSPAATAILGQAADELASATLAVARRLEWLDESSPVAFPLALAGGFLLGTTALRRDLVARLHESGARTSVITAVPEPVAGAVLLARKALESAAASG